MRAKTMGDPLADGIDVGPQARRDLRDDLHQTGRSIRWRKARGSCSAARFRPDRGSFYPPTVLTDVKPGMPAYDEELFGPVAVDHRGSRRSRRRAHRERQHLRLGSRGVHAGSWRAASGSRASSRPGARSSTRSSRPIRGCRSAESKSPATDASSARTASTSS